MCRSIKKLRNAEPAVTADDIRAAARQFVRKVSGFQKPSRANEAVFEGAVEEIAKCTEGLLEALEGKRVAELLEIGRKGAEHMNPTSPVDHAAMLYDERGLPR